MYDNNGNLKNSVSWVNFFENDVKRLTWRDVDAMLEPIDVWKWWQSQEICFTGKTPSLSSRSLSALPKHSPEFTKTPKNVSKDKAKSARRPKNYLKHLPRN